MPLPPLLLPKPLEELEELDDEPMPLLPELDDDTLPELEDELPAAPREPADVAPALRLAVDEPLPPATDAALLPVDDELTSPATDAALAVAAPAATEAAAAVLLVAATPPPVPEDWPETAERDAWSAVLREAACEEATVAGVEPLGGGGGA
jgi:hypothetical protein